MNQQRTFEIVRQNADINARASDFPYMEMDELLISSIFETVQGEGPFAGQRALFVRTSGCNFGAKEASVACQWCDTDFRISKGRVVRFDEILAQVKAANWPLLVLTGGEPLLQPNAVKFIQHMLVNGVDVQVETNGSFLFKLNSLAYQWDTLTVVCSPKQVGGRYSAKPPVFDYEGAQNQVHFKFVISAHAQAGHTELPNWICSPDFPATWWVSPMTVYRKAYEGEVSSVWDSELVDQAATAANYSRAAQLVMEIPGLRFTCQLHTLMGIA